jgi:hypothetical protein
MTTPNRSGLPPLTIKKKLVEASAMKSIVDAIENNT